MPAHTVRLTERSAIKLTSLARSRKLPKQAVVEEALDDLYEKDFWARAQLAFKKARSDQATAQLIDESLESWQGLADESLKSP